MANLPAEGMHRIGNFDIQCAATLQGNVLHGKNTIGTNVTLQYTIMDQGLCTLRVNELFLGVDAIEANKPVILVDKPHLWILQQNGNGFTIKYAVEPNGVQYFWRLKCVEQPVVISDELPAQTWSFNIV